MILLSNWKFYSLSKMSLSIFLQVEWFTREKREMLLGPVAAALFFFYMAAIKHKENMNTFSILFRTINIKGSWVKNLLLINVYYDTYFEWAKDRMSNF